MLGYLKKFTIDILPSIIATIVGAFIVHHYIIPAATPKNPAPAVANVTSKPDDALDKDSFAKGVAEKSAIEKTAEKAAEKSNDAAPTDSRKRHTASHTPARTDEPAAIEERRDANNLARAAIERLRNSETPRTVAVAPAQAATPVAQPQPNPSQQSLPALPPPVSPPEVFTSGTGPVIAPRVQPAQPPVRSAEAARPTPPEAIPAPPPLALHDDIVTTATTRATTVADDVMSAAKSIIHTVLPR